MKTLCPGGGRPTWEAAGKNQVHYLQVADGERPVGAKRKRLTCPHCGRRLQSSISYCQDGCCVIHTIPPHKPKGWWKRNRSHGTPRRHPNPA